jgi:beta-glucosidase
MKANFLRILLTALLLMQLHVCLFSQNETFRNPGMPIQDRVNDLVGRMTLDEKISQMMDVAAGIPRLGIPVYNWWNEGLHGVARADIATVFPQAIGLAATFNDSLHFEIANVISDEFRAKYNYYQSINDFGRYKGLTVWSPNINIFRDPRWGRGQETYGEDPFLTSRFGVAFIKGLQGNDPVYLKTIATPKHYVVHSGPESLRHVYDARISQYDFIDTYLPAFEACIKEGHAFSIMSAYNSFRGKSCTASDTLTNVILRNDWGFRGYVVSDCGAVTDVYATHKIVKTPAEAAALSVKSGVDLECGETYQYLHEAVDKGYLSEADIDIAVKRLFLARFKLGMFDPAGNVPYNKIPISVNDSESHRKLALEASRQSIILLKNENILPLSKSVKNILVIGPNANERDVLYGNYNGTPSKSTTILEGIKNKLGNNVNIVFQQGCNYVDTTSLISPVKDCFVDGLKAEYFNNKDLEGQPVVTQKQDCIKFVWADSPTQGINKEHYSIRWTGELIAPATGVYEFSMAGDDGYRLFINDNQLLSDWTSHGVTSLKSEIKLQKGKKYKLRAEFFNGLYGASVSLNWKIPGTNPESEALAAAKKADVIIFVGGLSPQLEGEEMDVKFDGFAGGDRTSIDLPAVQTRFLKKLATSGKPIALVLLNGSALAVNWEAQNIPAIVEAWYPGQDGGQAVADVLFGDYNPSGRLPVTFYKSVSQLPAFTDYAMKGRTYRYFKGESLYPFGFGLSYTTFKYSNLKLPTSITATDKILVSVDVENTGKVEGDEVVELYIKNTSATVEVPIHSLQGFKRVHLKPGEHKTVTFQLKPSQVSVINSNNLRVVQPGKIEVLVGGHQPFDGDKIILKGSLTITGNETPVD